MAVYFAPGVGEGLDPLMRALINKEQLTQEKERIKLQRADFELRQETAMAEQQRLQDAMAGATAAAQLFAMQRPEIGAVMDTLAPGAMPSFVESLQGFDMGQAQVVGQELGNVRLGSDVRVATGTEQARIQVGNMEPAVAAAQLAQTQAATRGVDLNNALMELKRNNDPQRVAEAWRLMESGQVTWEQASSAFGISNNDALPADFKLAVAPAGGAGGAGGEAARRAASLYGIMKASAATMDRLSAEGVDLGFIGSLNRSASNAAWAALTNAPLGDKEQQLIDAQKQFSNVYRLFISGQQSAVTEAERLLFTINQNPGDSEGVKQQKAFMRDLIMGMVSDAAAGLVSPVRAAQQILDAATSRGMPEEALAVFREQLADAVVYEAEGGYFGSQRVSADPTTPDTLPQALTRADEILNDMFGPAGN